MPTESAARPDVNQEAGGRREFLTRFPEVLRNTSDAIVKLDRIVVGLFSERARRHEKPYVSSHAGVTVSNRPRQFDAILPGGVIRPRQ